VAGNGGKVLLLSMRRLADLVAFSLQYEFEDVVAEVTGADRIDARGLGASSSPSPQGRALHDAITAAVARALTPKPFVAPLTRDYELFLPVFNHTHELFALAVVPDWRRRCRMAACFINRYGFISCLTTCWSCSPSSTHIFLGTRHCVEELSRIVGRPCSYLPLAVDVIRFSPLPELRARACDRRLPTSDGAPRSPTPP
jgi:hypothetical protein